MFSRIQPVALRIFLAAAAVVLLGAAVLSQQQNESQTTGHFDPKSLNVKFEGEAKQGEAFEKPLGSGLVFRLAPQKDDTGWEIRVIPDSAPNGKDVDFVWVVTPPYRSSNPRYLDTQYAISAKEAVAWSPRDFSFVLTTHDFEAASAAVDKALWPQNDQQEAEGLGELAEIPVGAGKLTILDSRVTAGKGEGDFGSIDWIKFTVELRLPCSFPVSKELTADHSQCSDHASSGR